jgi:predicted DNA binding CopG/RHH family protein
MKPIYDLTKEEQDILDSYERGEWKTVPNVEKEKEKLIRSAKATLKKSKNINLRMQPISLEKLKGKAIKLGLPYQTLASSILHQYASGQTITP